MTDSAFIHRARAADLPIILELVAEFCMTDHHTFDAGRVTRAVIPLLESDDLGVVYLTDNNQGYLVVT